jgi:hypothetical protein
LKQRPIRSEIELFKTNLKNLLAKVEAKESEENKKNHVRDFLLETYYKATNEINTKDRKDLVIHLGKTNADKVGVILVEIPIPQITPEEQKPFIELVDKILAKKKSGKETQDLENTIDAMVYKLYELTADVIKIVGENYADHSVWLFPVSSK